jgi:hypothetical protein
MSPKFSKTTKDILGRRSAFLCSNPDCRTTTSGPTVDPSKAVNLGEAAHIYGAYPDAARYRSDMTDGARAEITNGIWLCRNCHKLVDNDADAYPAEVLFQWRRGQERHVAELVGSRAEVEKGDLAELALTTSVGGPLARQIVREKLPGWEFRLIAELLRCSLLPAFKTWSELKGNLTVKKVAPISDDEALRWFEIKLDEAMSFIGPLTALYTVELPKTWGPPGVPGDVQAIGDICRLIGDLAKEMIRWEGDVKFIWVSETYRGLLTLLPGIMGRNLEKLSEVPAVLDAGIDQAEANPDRHTVIEHTLVFDLPDGWEKAVSKAMNNIKKKLR